MRRASYSFFAVFIGWLIPLVGYLAWMQFGKGFGYITDFAFILFWPLLFSFLGWLLVGLPLVLILKGERFRSPLAIIPVAVASTTVVFLGIAALFQFGLLSFLWWPVLIGLFGGATFWLLQRYEPGKSWIFWIAPVAFFPFVRFVLLPLGIAFFPYTTHVLAEGAIGNEALFAVMRRVQVGDSFEDLNRKYPQLFPEPILGTSFYSGNSSYTFSFDDSRQKVTKIEVKEE